MSPNEDPTAPELSEGQTAELTEALANAYAPAELDPQVNERLIHAALLDPLAPPTEEELVESERLRRALQGEADHEDLDLIRALGSAHRSKLGSAPETERLIERATNTALGKPATKQGGTVVYLTFAGVLTAAAAVLLFVQAPNEQTATKTAQPAPAAATPPETLELSRSSEELFDQRFDRGGASHRIDLIASARARDLRANRFRQWGVK